MGTRYYPSDSSHLKTRKTKYRLPKKGTKRRELLLLLMRPQGCTRLEATRRMDISPKSFNEGIRTWIKDDSGFDVQRVARRQELNAYKIVGKYKWNGEYRSFGLRGSQ